MASIGEGRCIASCSHTSPPKIDHRKQWIVAQIIAAGDWPPSRLTLERLLIADLRVIELPDRAGPLELRSGRVEGGFEQLAGRVASAITNAPARGPIRHAIPGRPAPHPQLEFWI